MTHELKILPPFFEAVRSGVKTFEVRKNDRGFQSGDSVVLMEWDSSVGPVNLISGYTGRFVKFTIGYVLAIDAERVVFSLLRDEEQE